MVCQTILRYDNGLPVYKQKKKFETHADAIAQCKIINSQPQQIHRMVSYKCPNCFKYHIGRTLKELK